MLLFLEFSEQYCVYVHGITMHMEIQDNSMESVLSYLYMGPEDQTQVSLQVPLPTDLLMTSVWVSVCIRACVELRGQLVGRFILFHHGDPAT